MHAARLPVRLHNVAPAALDIPLLSVVHFIRARCCRLPDPPAPNPLDQSPAVPAPICNMTLMALQCFPVDQTRPIAALSPVQQCSPKKLCTGLTSPGVRHPHPMRSPTSRPLRTQSPQTQLSSQMWFLPSQLLRLLVN